MLQPGATPIPIPSPYRDLIRVCEVVDEYDAVNDIALDWSTNSYAQRNVYTRTKTDPETGAAVRVTETRQYTAFWDGCVMQIQGKVLVGHARASNEGSRRSIVLHFRTTPLHPMVTPLLFPSPTLGTSKVLTHSPRRGLDSRPTR